VLLRFLAAIVAIFSRASLRRGMALSFVALVVLLGEIALVVAAVILSSHK
jgi:hypothetical protein